MLTKKYYWSREEEAKLLELYKKGVTDPNVLAKELGRKPRAVEMKLQRMGVVVVEKKLHTTTTVSLAEDLLTHEQALKVLAGAIELLRQRVHVSHNIGELWSMRMCSFLASNLVQK